MKILKIFLGIIIYLSISTNLVSAADTNYTYTNQEQDKSGLMHYDSRYYDPELGRFLQPDSFDVPNKYAYVSNNPVNRIDPSGHIDADTFFGFGKSYIPKANFNYYPNFGGDNSFHKDGSATVYMNNYDVGGGEGTPIGEMLSDGTKSILSEIWRAGTVLHRIGGAKINEGPDISTDDYLDIAMAPLGMVGGPLGIKGISQEVDLINVKYTKIVNESISGIRKELGINSSSKFSILRRWQDDIVSPYLMNVQIYEVPLSNIYATHPVGKFKVLDSLQKIKTYNYYLDFPINLRAFYKNLEIFYITRGFNNSFAGGHHRTAAMGILDQETIPALIYFGESNVPIWRSSYFYPALKKAN